VPLVLLREVFEASFKEIAQANGKTEAACRQQLHRALLRLRQGKDGKTAGRKKPSMHTGRR
jgi:DNA-directed RNA polymerase specialized sigma24 family protein